MNSTTTLTSQSETRMGRHPLIWGFALAYAISWPMWLLSHLAGGTLEIVLRCDRWVRADAGSGDHHLPNWRFAVSVAAQHHLRSPP